MIQIAAITLSIIFFSAAALNYFLSLQSIAQQVNRYDVRETMINPRGFYDKISSHVFNRIPGRYSLFRDIHSRLMVFPVSERNNDSD
jgi:hypothetical protein